MTDFSTPMMKQYLRIKSQYKDCLLFFRLGDFYELFMGDAKTGAEVLDITLTSRDRGKDGRVPMCGVPYHAVDSYLYKLTKAGYKVAICEQVTLPNGRGIVEREVVRVVTPGTVLDENSLEKKENNYIISLVCENDFVGIAAADVSTGIFTAGELRGNNLINTLSQFNPSECILPDDLYNNPKLLKQLKSFRDLNIYRFEYDCNVGGYLKKHFNVKTLLGFGIEGMLLAQTAAARLLEYLKETQKRDLSHINKLIPLDDKNYVSLDRATILNLELFTTIRDHDKRGALINVLDKTSTAMGGRMLRSWILKPLSSRKEITKRLDSVEELLKNRAVKTKLHEELSEVSDIERLLSKLSLGAGNARDLVNLKTSLQKTCIIKKLTNTLGSLLVTEIRGKIHSDIQKVIDLIETNIKPEPPLDVKKGSLIQTGVNKELDELKQKVNKSKDYIYNLELTERQKTGINSLKVKFNQVFGYYIEITKANLENVPSDYFRKQTLVNAERFITPGLKEHEEIILTAEEKINALEYKIFEETVTKVLEKTAEIQESAQSVAVLDCLINFAELAQKENYTKPEITENGGIEIIEGRHPVVEKLLDNMQFAPNNTLLNDKNQLLIITGPNMAGKSVYIRQNALIVLMAQIGCFVPAEKAKIALVDKIFVRSGASDVITSGLSTFMVEMVETAYILNTATDKSLIVMDEIGRGTSTYDGISIAWAVCEYLATRTKAKVLFATHYHELQKLEEKFPQKIKNYQMRVDENKGEPVFVHKVVAGGADHSYGIAVAKLAGVPNEAIERAYGILDTLENGKGDKADKKVSGKFARVESEVLRETKNLDLNRLTPLDALNVLSRLQKLASSHDSSS